MGIEPRLARWRSSTFTAENLGNELYVYLLLTWNEMCKNLTSSSLKLMSISITEIIYDIICSYSLVYFALNFNEIGISFWGYKDSVMNFIHWQYPVVWLCHFHYCLCVCDSYSGQLERASSCLCQYLWCQLLAGDICLALLLFLWLPSLQHAL